jgi:hypothetical protein
MLLRRCKKVLEAHPRVWRALTRLSLAVACLLVIAVLPSSCPAEVRRLNINREYPVLEAENRVWIGMPGGLYQYNPSDDTYKRFTLPVEGPVPAVRDLYYSDEWLWCVLDRGLAALHVRLNEWLYFDAGSGLPSGTVRGLGFHEDYVWLAADMGVARYDLFIEEWEIYDRSLGIPDDSAWDVIGIDENVWLLTDHLFSQYDPEFEKWRHYAIHQDSSATLNRGFVLGGELWILTDRGLTRFNTSLQTQRSFTQAYLLPENLLEVVIEDNSIWAVTRLGIFQYDQVSAVWREFAGNSYLEGYDIVGGYVSRTEVWVLTGETVLVYDRTEKTWEILDYASGLSTPRFATVYVSGGLALLINPDGIDYRPSENDLWRKYAIRVPAGAGGMSGRNVLRNLFDNEEGGYIPLGKYRWSWEGTNMTFVYTYEQRYDDRGQGLGAITKSGERFDIKSQLDLGGGRAISGYYNNIDYTETMYGIRYRSRAEDFLREVNWGDFRRESGAVPFAEAASVFGGNVWLQAGPKTPRFKRSYLTVKGQTGERRSQSTYEHYVGATRESAVYFRDTDYVQNQFFAVPGFSSFESASQVEIFIDDLIPGNNDPNTIEGAEIAGVVGDYDLAKATEGYYLYERGGVVRFMQYISPAWTVVARVFEGAAVHEEVLQYGGSVTTVRNNLYYLSAREIIAYSFDLNIWDSSGQEVPLSDFGIDANGDGAVDSEWIDYDAGILFFPDEEPFPPPVYDPDNPESFYALFATFHTDLEIIQLAHKNLVRGTEILLLDGIAAKAGSDYVLDYTNGTLVFVREGIVNIDTRVEIVYEYHITTDNTQVHSALVNVSPSDNYFAQADWIQFTSTPDGEISADEPSNLVALTGEVRDDIGGFDVRVVPGVSYQAEQSEVTGGYVDGLVSSSRLRFQTTYAHYAEKYSNLFRPQFILGDVRSNLDLFLTVDARDDLRLTGSYRDVEGFGEGEGAELADRSGLLGFLLHRNNWPGWEFQYQTFRTREYAQTLDRYFFQNRIDYRAPKSVSDKILLEDLRLELYLRTGRQSGEEKLESAEQEFHNGFVRLNADVSDRFQTSLFYRRNDLNDVTPGVPSAPMTRAERLLVTFSHEEWRLVQTNFRIENTLDQGFHRSSPVRDARLNLFSQLNVRFSPGASWESMSPLFFEFGLNQTTRGYATTGDNIGGWLWRMFGFDGDNLDDSFFIRNYYLRNEYRPSPGLFFDNLFEWNDQETALGLSGMETGFWRWSGRGDIKIGYKTRLTLRYTLHSEDFGYVRKTRYHEPSAWLDYRMTSDLQNTFYARYRRTGSDEGNISDATDDIEGRYDLIWRKQSILKMRRLEVRQTFSGNHSRTEGYNDRRTYDFASSTGIDLYPIHSLIIRFQLNLSKHIDQLTPLNDYSRVAFDLRTAFRF